MPLRKNERPFHEAPPSAGAETLIREAQERIRAFQDDFGDAFPLFISSDPYDILEALAAIPRREPSPLFCEWGCGFGLIAALADFLGYQAVGIEIEPQLVQGARSLCHDLCLDAQFACGDIDPAISPENNPYKALQINPNEIDLFFAYPRPGETKQTLALFDRIAKVGASLLTYHGFDEIEWHQKT